MKNIAEALDTAVRAVCPIDGVSIGRDSDKTTWRIDFVVSATAQQRSAAAAVVAGFDIATVPDLQSRDVAVDIADIKTRLAALEGGRVK